jgi:outer membrane protein
VIAGPTAPAKAAPAKASSPPCVLDPLDKEAAARRPEMRGTVDNLQAALESAYRTNTELKEIQSEARSVDEKVPQALAGWRPTVNLEASITGDKQIYSGNKKEDGDQGQEFPQSRLRQTTAEATVSLTQNLFNSGKTVATTCQAENQVRAARAKLADKERDVLLNAVQAYFAVLAKHAELEYRKSNEHWTMETLKAARDKFNVGEETRTTIAQAEAEHDDAIATRQTTEAQLISAEATFERITGTRPGKLRKPGDIANLPRGLKEAFEIAQKNNPAIIQAIFQEKADRNSIRIKDADLLPKVDFKASAQRTGQLSRGKYTFGRLQDHDFTTDQQVAIQVTMPLYEAGTIRSQSRELREIAEQRRINIETVRRQVLEKLEEAWETYLSSKLNVKSYQAQVKAYQVSLEGTRQELLVGSKILLDVLNEQRKLVQAQLNLVQAEQAYYQNAYAVLAYMGRLSALDMKLKVKRYDPQLHYRDVKYSW